MAGTLGCGSSPVQGWGMVSYWKPLLQASHTQDVDEDGVIEAVGFNTLWRDEGYRPEIDVNNNNFHEPAELFYMALDSEDFSVDEFVQFGDAVVTLAQQSFVVVPSERAVENWFNLLTQINSKSSKAALRHFVDYGPNENNPHISARSWQIVAEKMVDGFGSYDREMQAGIVLALVKGLCSPLAGVKEFVQVQLDKLLANPESESLVLETFGDVVGAKSWTSPLYVTEKAQTASLEYLSRVPSPGRAVVFVTALNNLDFDAVDTAANALLVYKLDGETALSLAGAFAADAQPERKAAVVRVLETVNDPVVIPFLLAYRAEGLSELSFAFDEATIIDALVSGGLTSENETVRVSSERALAERGDAVLPRLQQAYETKTLSYEEYFKMLGQIGTINAQRKLVAAVERQCSAAPDALDVDCCVKGVKALGDAATPATLQSLVRIFERTSEKFFVAEEAAEEARGAAWETGATTLEADAAKATAQKWASIRRAALDNLVQLGETQSAKAIPYLYKILASGYVVVYEIECERGEESEETQVTNAFLAAIETAGKSGKELDQDTVLRGQVFAMLNSMKYDIETWLKDMKENTESGWALKDIATRLLARIETQRRTNPIFIDDVSRGDQRGINANSYQHGLALRVLALPKDTAFCRLVLTDPRTGKDHLQENWQMAYVYSEREVAAQALDAVEAGVGGTAFRPSGEKDQIVQGSAIAVGLNFYAIYLDSRNTEVPATLSLYNYMGKRIKTLHLTIRNPGIELDQ